MDSKISKLLNIKRYLNKTLFKTPGVEYLRKNHSFVEKKKDILIFGLIKLTRTMDSRSFFLKKVMKNYQKILVTINSMQIINL
tara:strand:- start:48 stop:296 length:249 start_codon:yes stop_codon:yes gene_type:complete